MVKFISISIFLLLLILITSGCVTTTNSEKAIADDLASKIQLTGKIDDALFNDYSNFQHIIEEINTIIRITNEQIHTTIPEMGTSSSDYEKFKTYLKYSPLIGSYNDLYDSAIKLPSQNDSNYTEFYLKLGKFGVDYGLISSRVSYHIAYTATGEVISKLGLNRLYPYIGYEGVAAIESYIHWELRDEINSQINYFYNYVENYMVNSTI